MKKGASGSVFITTFTFDELTPAKCWIAPEIPIAIYKFDETGFPVCPTCSLWGLQPKSETGFEHAVAAPKTSAKFSMRCQFSGPFNPLPPETTISASAIVTLFDVFSTENTLFLLSEMLKLKSEISVSVGFSFRPKEFF